MPLVTTNASAAPVTLSGFLLPGFPGQLQTLPDLYYNQYRDYDPTLGRYTQGDPIGLDGGANPYVYAENNPLRNIDPRGLFVPPAGGIVGGIIGGAEAGGEIGAEGGTVAEPGGGTVVGAVGGAIVGAAIGGGVAIYNECHKNDPCRTISGRLVPVGTVAYRPLDTPSRPQHGILGSHYNLYRANKNPNNGRCFWQSIGAVSPGGLPRGAIPIEPFAN